jgi:predicted pyridoxine 5'-phosphate oxidase superfamily flavin-nucleotide-binding protein
VKQAAPEEQQIQMSEPLSADAQAVLRPDEVMFSSSVRAQQECHGSREAYARRAARGGFAQALSPEAVAFIGQRDSAYLATASADGQPYVQHRGGPRGFLKVLDERTVTFAEYPGNRQYISTGNLAENERSFLFLMDYENAQRLKLWGRARVVNEPSFVGRLSESGHSAQVEHAIVFYVLAWDWNCSKHIPKLIPAPQPLSSGQR